MASVLLSDYTAAKSRVQAFCNTVGYSYSWRYAPQVGDKAMAAHAQELQDVTHACGARVNTGCSSNCSANYSSNYASNRSHGSDYWGTDSGYRWKT